MEKKEKMSPDKLIEMRESAGKLTENLESIVPSLMLMPMVGKLTLKILEDENKDDVYYKLKFALESFDETIKKLSVDKFEV